MKKTFVMALCLIGAAATASAQLKIHSNGNMSLLNPDTAAYSPVSLNCNGDSTIFMKYEGDLNGISCTANKKGNANRTAGYFESSSKSIAIGVNGTASTSTPYYSFNDYSIGVLGNADNTGRTFSYGVAGIFSANLGAGIYGSSYGDVDYPSGLPTGRYAGYFDGTTKVVGDFYATGSINGTVVLGNSSTSSGLQSVKPLSSESCNITGMLSRLRAQTYYQPALNGVATKLNEDGRLDIADETDGKKAAIKSEQNIIGEQIHTKMHYALSANELEEVFPDLVYTDQNGEKSINYMELVPLLVQCINELNVRLSAVDGGKVGAEPVLTRKAGTIETAIDGTTAKTQAVLYQNSPNPFTAQTEIRFSLPADAPQAYIYIFDMTGKMQKQIPVDANQQSITINGYELQAGIYLYSLVVGGQEIDTKRMILLK